MHTWYNSQTIMKYGLQLLACTTLLFSVIAITFVHYVQWPSYIMIFASICMQMITMFSICITTSNALALALVDYNDVQEQRLAYLAFSNIQHSILVSPIVPIDWNDIENCPHCSQNISFDNVGKIAVFFK